MKHIQTKNSQGLTTQQRRVPGPRAAALLLLSLCASLLLGGCMAPAYIATELEKSGNDKALKGGMAVLRQHIQTLQDKGDPLGDYFYALGNSDGWIKDVSDPQAITALFEKAAAKGSMDAKILLALQKASSDPKPGELDTSHGPSGNLKAWEAGLAELLPLLQQQCYARRLVIGGPVLGDARPRVRYYSVAYYVWPEFRDGYYRLNPDGTRTLLKDAKRQKLWEDIHRKCDRPQNEWLDTLYQNG
ncbi:hypothetical protein H010_13721 [Hydrogenophaga taeniospiralis CCUG 15921]|uniref:Uncharacterized protein n=1 Tax=Hydrogenophaga taeniospiralis CCUG 15921 TaxID=1281780 RepID=A0A9X4P4T4_9BURK|nr:hypothetical protein [Hydrogenophaga taeniospiralis]MDG5976318.1 hypothetical protein [Hydrogenophaga taeniospiralis CCUG 15921]